MIDRAPPNDPAQGNSLIGMHVFPRLARRHELTLVAPATDPDGTDRETLRQAFTDIRLVPVRRPIAALQGYLDGIGGRGDAGAVGRAVADAATEGPFEVVHVRQLPMAAHAARLRSLPRMLELVDSEALQARRRITAMQPGSWVRYAVARRVERDAVRRFSRVTTVAHADADMIRRLSPSTQVEVIPNGVDAAWFRPHDEPSGSSPLLVFHGAMSFPPNETAARWIVRQVLPRLRDAAPDATLALVGRDPSPGVLALAGPHVTVTGAVDDVRTWLARATVVVCPMRSGSGIKNKVLEALAMGRPVVSTRLGVEGLDVRDGVHVEEADDADAFADRIARLLGDPDRRRRLGAEGRRLVEARYTWDACADAYDRLYRDLADSGRSG